MENQGTEFDVGEDISDREAMNRHFGEDKHGGWLWNRDQFGLVAA